MGPVQRLALLPITTCRTASFAGCGNSSPADPPAPAPLNAAEVNLIFVVSEDIAYQEPGDVNPTTANLTDRGLQRVLVMGTFLQQQVLAGSNVTSIYALEPMTHLQTANAYPDMVALETIQQFAMLNLRPRTAQAYPAITANSYPLFASTPPDPYRGAWCHSCRSVRPARVSTSMISRGRQRSAAPQRHPGQCPGLLCFLRALGDDQRCCWVTLTAIQGYNLRHAGIVCGAELCLCAHDRPTAISQAAHLRR